jgi:hypothetical protein
MNSCPRGTFAGSSIPHRPRLRRGGVTRPCVCGSGISKPYGSYPLSRRSPGFLQIGRRANLGSSCRHLHHIVLNQRKSGRHPMLARRQKLIFNLLRASIGLWMLILIFRNLHSDNNNVPILIAVYIGGQEMGRWGMRLKQNADSPKPSQRDHKSEGGTA